MNSEQTKKMQSEINSLKEKIAYYEKILEDTRKQQTICQNNQEKFRSIFDNANDAIFLMSTDKFVDCNRKAEELFQCSKDEILNKTPIDFSPPFQPDGLESSKAALDKIGAALRGDTQRFFWQHRTKTGYPIDCEVGLNRLELQGKMFLQAIVRDVSKRAAAERALHEKNLQYESLFRNSLVGIWRMEFEEPISIDASALQVAEAMLDKGYFGECNDALLQMYGVTSKEELSISDINVFGTSREEALEYLEMFIYNNFSTVLLDATGVDKQGEEKSFRFSYVGYVKDKYLHWVWGIQLDLTEQKMLEKQFLQSQKMEAIGMLAGGIAHDFNNLLTVINGYSELMAGRVEVDSPLLKHILAIQKAGQKAANLTGQLLAFSRKQVLQPKIVYLNEIIEKLMKMIQRLIGEGIDVKLKLADDLGRIKVDPVKVEQILMNLAVNARDAMPDGGSLVFETQNFTIDKEFTESHNGAKTGQYVMFAVTDTGVGMNKEVQARIFEPFYSTKDKALNTGLGLSTVYGIVKQSNGYIDVISSPKEGTTFRIFLPRVEHTISIEDDDVFGSSIDIKGTETILLVEDAENVREVIAESLSNYGYTILEAEDGEDALRKVMFHKGTIDLVLTDVVMPKMDGHIFVRRLKPILPDIKIVFMSGYTEDTLLKKGELNRDIEFVQKPFNLVDLARRIRKVLDN